MELLEIARRKIKKPLVDKQASMLLIATGEGVLRFRRLQRPGGRMLSAGEFLRGFAVPRETRIPSRPMLPLVTVAK